MPVEPSARLQLVIEPDLRRRITDMAKTHRRSTSAEICVAIEAWLKQHDAEEAE
jgi:predicted transcriptional regulator